MRIANCKLSYAIIDKIMTPYVSVRDKFGNESFTYNLTSSELSLLFYLSVRQDPWGRIHGIYYKDVTLELGLKSKQSFYNALYGLRDKGYIHISPDSIYNETWDCYIIDNTYANKKDDKKGYFNTNRAFLHSPDFHKLKVNEKKLCILLAIKYQPNYLKYGLEIRPETVAVWLGIKSTF